MASDTEKNNTTLINSPDPKLALGIPAAIFLTCFFITCSAKFKLHTGLLSNAILIDMLITAPLAYFIVIRKTAVSKVTVLRVFITGLFLAGWILNSHTNSLLQGIKTWVLPVLEAFTLYYTGRKFYVAHKEAKLTGNNTPDFLTHCRAVLCKVSGHEKAGNIFASEIAVFYYIFIGKKNRQADYQTTFSNYKENGILLVLSMILVLFLLETLSSHFLFVLWNKTLAWVLTGLSFYTCMQLFAHIKAVRARPLILSANALEIHNGLAGDAIINYTNIERVEISTKAPATGKTVKISLLKGLEGHNCIIYLKKPIEATKIFGIKKEADTILFFVDHLKDFTNALNARVTLTHLC